MMSIHVQIDEELLGELDLLSRKQNRSRAELILDACRRYVRQLETATLDQSYRESYETLPEDTSLAQTQVALLKNVLVNEEW